MARCALALAPLCALVASSGCQTGREGFVGGRLANLCNESYTTCGVTAGCELDPDHYVEGVFPGARRVLVVSEGETTTWSVRVYLDVMIAPGTEFLAQIQEPDCSLDTVDARAHLLDVDLFEEAGDDRTLLFELETGQAGEHLVELYSDASAEYLLVVEAI